MLFNVVAYCVTVYNVVKHVTGESCKKKNGQEGECTHIKECPLDLENVRKGIPPEVVTNP